MCEAVVYILGLYHCFGELGIYGVYTDRKELYEKYQMLLREDDICLDHKNLEKPHIYQLPLNTFIGEKMDRLMFGWDCDSILIMNPKIIRCLKTDTVGKDAAGLRCL